MKIVGNRVFASAHDVATFNRAWPGSSLRDRGYWFEFDCRGDLVDTNVPYAHDGPAVLALANDCAAFLGKKRIWIKTSDA